MKETIEQEVDKVDQKQKNKRQRYNGKVKRREWTNDPEEAAKRPKLDPADRIKRKKSAVMLAYSGVGYSGMQRNPGQKTIEEDILKAMLKNNWITEDGYQQPQQAQFQRAARTDKNVSAARQVVSLKLPESIDIEAINKDLPDVIRIFSVKRVTKGFNSKTSCDARTYSYTLPTYTLAKKDESIEESIFRLSPERLEELNNILKLYIGTRNYHNFTIRKEATDPSAKRFIMSFECPTPFVPDNTEVEFARLKITGQSFMMHQIRKMVGLVIAIMRGYKAPETISLALKQERVNIPQAPGLGLVLDRIHYTRYNERYGEDGVHEKLLFEAEDDKVEEFFKKNIVTNILETELKSKNMHEWVKTLDIHSFDVKEKQPDDEEETIGNNSD